MSIPSTIKSLSEQVAWQFWQRVDRVGAAVENFFRPFTDEIDWDVESPRAAAPSFTAHPVPAAGDGPRRAPDPPAGADHPKPKPVTPADVILAHEPTRRLDRYIGEHERFCRCSRWFPTKREWAEHVIKQLNQLQEAKQ